MAVVTIVKQVVSTSLDAPLLRPPFRVVRFVMPDEIVEAKRKMTISIGMRGNSAVDRLGAFMATITLCPAPLLLLELLGRGLSPRPSTGVVWQPLAGNSSRALHE